MVLLDPDAADPFEIIVGTYEQYLLGYKVENVVNEYKMEKTFATHSHLASIRSVASGKHYLASAGADDSVYLYDMRYRAESGRLMHHNDTINCIAFTPEASHLFTCSNDGTIAAIRCGSWQVEKHWQKPHKGLAVNTLAIHPTGKIALSTGADGILRTWNLVKGRQAYATNLVPRLKLDAKNVTVLKWSPNGEKYLLAVNQRIDIYSVELAGIDDEISFDSKIVCVEFLRDDLIAVGLENGQIKFYDLEKSVQTIDAIAHDIRVKCMAHKDDLLVTASSSGEIKLWRFSKHKLHMLQSVNCGARITCLSLALPCKQLIKKKKIKTEEEEEDEDEESEDKPKSKLRFRQEVIVEHEDDWEVTSIEPADSAKTKSKKKRSIDETAEEEIKILPEKKKNKFLTKKRQIPEVEDIEDSPKEKKKLRIEDRINNNVSSKKRKKHIPEEDDIAKPSKKIKHAELTQKETAAKEAIVQRPKGGDVPSQKKKKKPVTEEPTTPLKKKKKKQ